MTDEATRAAERRWKATGDPADGQAWVEGELRATGAPILPMISMLITTTRMVRALRVLASTSRPLGQAEALAALQQVDQNVTPEDMVAFLRGDGGWRRGPAPLVGPPRACAFPGCFVGLQDDAPPGQAYCSIRCSERHRDALVAATRRCAVCGGASGPDGPAITNLTTGEVYCSVACSDTDTRRRCHAEDCDAIVPAGGAVYCSDSCARADA